MSWLLEHDDSVLAAELSDDSDLMSAYMDDSWSDHESVMMDDVPDDEVFLPVLTCLLAFSFLFVFSLHHFLLYFCVSEIVYNFVILCMLK